MYRISLRGEGHALCPVLSSSVNCMRRFYFVVTVDADCLVTSSLLKSASAISECSFSGTRPNLE